MSASVLDGEITFFSESKGDKITFMANKREIIEVGSNPNCDIRILGANKIHMKIELDSNGKVKATNLSSDHPIAINGDTIMDKRTLKSGDVISIMNHQLRWDTKVELRRRTAALTKSARKEAKHKVIRTAKRLTIHNLLSTRLEPPVEDDIQEQLDEDKQDAIETTPPNKENNLSKLSSLNLSGTLITSFTPQKNTPKASLRTPQKNSPAASTSDVSPKVLGEFSNLNRSMHLVDLTGTPLVKRNTRTPGTSAAKRTPLSVKKTPTVRTATKNETLLKSAIKNSSIKKRIIDTQPSSAAKGKNLFQSPIMDVSNTSSSVVSVSFSSTEGEEQETLKATKSVSECSNKSLNGSDETESDEETKKLLDDISIVLEETPKDNSVEADKTHDIEKNFEKIFEDTSIPSEEQIDSEFKIIETSQTNNDDPNQKAETLLNWIENARESLASNNTEQILSSRYSNVTPNDSIVTTVAYDTKTPKMSILDTVQDLRKNEGLAMSPVARLSINDNSTVVVENFKLNNDVPQSLRSTRKRIGKAMSSLHDISQNPNSTFDETMNLSTLMATPTKDQSVLETSTNNILSLDAPQEEPENTEEFERDENAENIPPSMTSNNFIDFAQHNDSDDTEREFFEISNSDVADEDLQPNQDSSSSSDESESSENESDIEEIVGSSQEQSKDVALKFRLSEQDLEEDGINPLDVSTRTEDENINQINSSQNEEDFEIPATQQMEEEATPQMEEGIEIAATQEFSTEQINDIFTGDGSISLLDSRTEEVETMIEEHLEASNVSVNEGGSKEVSILNNTIIEEEVKEEIVGDDVDKSEIIPSNITQDDDLSEDQVIALDLKERSTEEFIENAEDIIPCSEAVVPENILESDVVETNESEKYPFHEIEESADNPIIEDPEEQEEMLSSEEIIAETQKSAELSESIDIFASQDNEFESPRKNVQSTNASMRVSSIGADRSLLDTPNVTEESDLNKSEVEEACAVLEPIVEESVGIQISVSVKDSPNNIEAENIEPSENIEDLVHESPPEDTCDNQESNETSDEIVAQPELDTEEEKESNESNEEMKEPVVEEVCIKKVAYVTTDNDESEIILPEPVAKTAISEDAPEEINEDIPKLQDSSDEKIHENQEGETMLNDPQKEMPDDIEKQIESMHNPQGTDVQNVPLVSKVDIPSENIEESKAVIEPPTPRRRARVNYLELAAGSPAKTPGRRGRSASIETAPVTPKPPRSARKIMQPIAEKTSPSVQVEIEDFPPISPEKEKTPRKRAIKATAAPHSLRRGRSASVDIQQALVKDDKIISPSKSEKLESIKKKTAGRRRVVSESIDVIVPEQEEPPKKKARGRKAAHDDLEKAKPADDEPIKEVEEPIKKARGRKKIEKDVHIEETVKNVEASEKKEKSEEPKEVTPAKKGRGRKKIENIIAEEAKPIEEIAEAKKGRGRKKIEIEHPVEVEEKEMNQEAATSSKGRPRKAKLNDIPEKTETTVEEIVVEPKAKRGRVAPLEVIALPVKASRGRKKAEEKVDEPMEESETKPKTSRGRKKVEEKANEPTEEPETKSTRAKASREESPEKELPIKKGRGRKKVEENVEEPTKIEPEIKPRRAKASRQESPEKEVPAKAVRGRKKAEEKVEEPVTKTRGRAAKVKESEEVIEVSSEDNLTKQNTPPKKRTGKHVTIVTPSTEKLKKEEAEKVPETTTSRKRKAQIPTIIESPEPVAKRSTRKKK